MVNVENHDSTIAVATVVLALVGVVQTILLIFTYVGNPDDPADQDLVRKASPLFAVDQIKVPMLIAQGSNDVRVIQSESDQIVAAIGKKGGSVNYVIYPDEGHIGWRPQNSKDFVARTEKLLAEHLGGRYEPMEDERIEGSSALVRVIGPSSR